MITPVLGKGRLILHWGCARVAYLTLITSSLTDLFPQHPKKHSHPKPLSSPLEQLTESAHRSWQGATPHPVRSDAYSITCTTGPRRTAWPLTAHDELINHGHLLNSCSNTIINGSVDWAMQQRLLHLLKQQFCSAKGTSFTQPANRKNC